MVNGLGKQQQCAGACKLRYKVSSCAACRALSHSVFHDACQSSCLQANLNFEVCASPTERRRFGKATSS